MNRRFGFTNIGILVGLLIALAIIIGIVVVVRLDVTGQKGSGLGKEYIYDVSKYAKIDPALIMYKSAEKIATGLEQARSIAVDDDGNIYVAGDNVISILNGPTIKLAGEPRCLAVTDDGTIYIGFKEHIEVYDNNPEQSAKWVSLGKILRRHWS